MPFNSDKKEDKKMIRIREREILELLQFVMSSIFNNEYITKNKIENFNRFKQFVKIDRCCFIRSKKSKGNIKILDKDIVCLKIKRSNYSYYKLIIEIKNLSDKDIVLLKSIIQYLD